MAIVKIILVVIFWPFYCMAQSVPSNYNIVWLFDQTQNSSITCSDSGDGCDECEDQGARYFTGAASTNYDWSDLIMLDRSQSDNLIYDNIDTCTSSIASECHALTIESSGVPLYDGSTGAGIKVALVANCHSTEYSRADNRIKRGTYPQNDHWLDFDKFYIEYDFAIDDVTAIEDQEAVRFIEIFNYNQDFALRVLAARSGTGCTGGDSACMYGKLDASQAKDNTINLESDKAYRLRVYLTAHPTNGTFISTIECPQCTTPLAETVIKSWQGVQTADPNPTWYWIKLPSIASTGTTWATATVWISRILVAGYRDASASGASGSAAME